MEIIDEVTTPGCPQCAVKHLSAAIAYLALAGKEKVDDYDRVHVLLARAKINLVEEAEGYHSHHHLAIGLMEIAEEALATEGKILVDAVRKARLSPDPIRSDVFCLPLPVHYAAGHFAEAMRELPELSDIAGGFDLSVDWALHAVEYVRKEYFDPDSDFAVPEAAVAEGEDNKDKENDMATKKPAFLAEKAQDKKATKATKAACKGGKAACKGGKSKCSGKK